MKKIILYPLTLGVVALICGVALGTVHEIAQPIIDERIVGEAKAAIQEVLPTASAVSNVTAKYATVADYKISDVYSVNVGSDLSAYAYQASGTGYGGDMTFLMLVDAKENKFVGMKVISHAETKGGHYGAILLDNPEFAAQFKDLSLDKVTSSVGFGTTGSTAGVTLNAAVKIASNVATFHKAVIKNEELSYINKTDFQALTIPNATGYQDDWDYFATKAGNKLATVQKNSGIKGFYKIMQAEAVIGHAYYVEFTYVYEGHPQIMKLLYAITNDNRGYLNIIYSENSSNDGLSIKNYQDYLAQFHNVDLNPMFASLETLTESLDKVSGCTMTSVYLNQHMVSILNYHKSLKIGVGD